MDAIYEKLVPSPSPETQPYWDGLNEGRLRLQRCADCGKIRHYPRPMCDACWSMNVDWVDASGRGTVHSWTITHYAFHPGFKGELPYTLLTADLDEGVRMMTRIVDAAPGQVEIGLPVELTVRQIADAELPCFRPARPPAR